MAERRYNEKELAAILKAASEAQAKDLGPAEDSAGLTLSEIAKLATEVGIDPVHISHAAEKLERLPAKKEFNFWGASAQQVIERTVEGTFDDVGWEEAVAEMRMAYGSAGTASEIGTSREWSGGSEFRYAHISATPKNGKTRIRVQIHQEGALVVRWMFAFATSFFTSILIVAAAKKAHLPTAPVIGMILALVLTILLLTKWLVAKNSLKNAAQTESLMDRLGNLASIPTEILTENLAKESSAKELEQNLKQTP